LETIDRITFFVYTGKVVNTGMNRFDKNLEQNNAGRAQSRKTCILK